MNIRIDVPEVMCRASMKNRVDQLAVCGGAPCFAEPLHVGRPNVVGKAKILQRISDILDRSWLTNDGQVLKEFEQAVANYATVKHCIAVCNGTVALQLAMRGLDLQGEVILPALTFVATPHAVEWSGARSVFADVDRNHWTLDPVDALARINPQTTALVGVHLWGQVCDVARLADIATEHRLKLIYDASHALGCTHSGTPVGNFGDCETISFHATKFVNAAEGGAILTNNDDLAERLRWLRNFGFQDPGCVASIGTNGKMSEVSAAIGLTSLEHADRIIEINAENQGQYQTECESIPGVTIRQFNAGQRCNFQYVIAEVDETQAGLSRDELMNVLRAENVLARRYFYPGCHRLTPYEARGVESLPWTDAIVQRVLVLPTGIAVDQEDIRAIAQIMRLATTHAADLRRRTTIRQELPLPLVSTQSYPVSADVH